MKTIASVLLLAFTIVALGCQTTATKKGYEKALNDDETRVLAVPAQTDLQKVERAILYALHNRQWSVTNQSPQSITAELVHRDIRGKLYINYNTDRIEITSDSYKDDVEFVPVRWIEYLSRDIQMQLTSY